MADITVTATSVKPVGTSRTLQTVQYGGTVTHGQPVYADTGDGNQHKPCDADAAASAVCAGIAITPGGDNDYGVIQTSGQINIGGTTTVGQVYCISTNAGGICPYSDLGSGDYVTILGVSSANGIIDLDISVTGIAKA